MEYQNSATNFQNNPCEETKESMEKLKNELEQFYENKVVYDPESYGTKHGENSNIYF